MYFTFADARGATVHDLDRREQVQQVVAVDCENAEVEVIDHPMRSCRGEIATRKIKFQAVWPLWVDVDPDWINKPVAFHCHGRLN